MPPLDKLADHLHRLLRPGGDIATVPALTAAGLLERAATDERGGRGIVLMTLP